jgi:putative ABC transport system permease protein
MSHGTGKISFTHHADHPFKVVGISRPAGTPADQSLYIPLQSIDILHQTKQNKTKHIHDELLAYVPLGEIYQPQPRTILPALALRELWQIVGAV